MPSGLAVIETHPIQYNAPVYRELKSRHGIPVTAIYSSDFSVVGYLDKEFGASFRWDTDLLSGYRSCFLSSVAHGGARGLDAVSARGLRTALRETSPSAVLLTGHSPAFHRWAFFEARRLRCPLILRADSTDQARERGAFLKLIRDTSLQFMYGACSRLLCIGQLAYDHFRRLGVSEEKLVFSPRCVDTAAFDLTAEARVRLRTATREQIGIGDTDYVILFSGKLSEQKAPHLLLRAVRSLPPETRERITVVFLGSGELQGALEQLAAGSPAIRARFTGFQNQTQLSPYYHAADLLALPSRSETWGLVVNEALHHGVPCVVSEGVGCAPDLIEPGITGEIAATGSAESLAAAINRALALVGRPEIRERCCDKVSGYTVEKAAQGIAQAYREVVQAQ
jgi:glycosyltransferase involved in cell wall biosynthesis